MVSDNSILFHLRRNTPLLLGGYAVAMLAAFPFLPPQIAALLNLGLVVVANLLGFWRWGLAATAWTIIITWIADSLFWHAGFGVEIYLGGGLFNLLLTAVFGTALAAKNHQMVTDGLTGLSNSQQFHTMLSWEVRKARRYGRPLALIMIDLDDFKPLNDRHGHPAGDQVLRDFATRLKALCRTSDLAARYGGDEFALILPETDLAGARQMIDRLRAAVAAHPWQHEGMALKIRASAGAAAHQPGQTAGQLLREADRALYADKHRH